MWITLVAMTLSNSMILVDQTAVPLATPEVIRALRADLAMSPWILTANILPLAACMVLGGRLGDMLGLRRVFLVGATIFLVATALAGAAQDLPWMIAARAVQGVGAALMMPNAVAITSAVWPAERRGYALGVLAGASAFFAALGPVLGGVLTSISWRAVFWINVPLAVLTIVLTMAATPALAQPATRRRVDWAGAACFAGAIVSLVYGLGQGQPDGWAAPQTVVPLLASMVFAAVFVVVERRVQEPLIDFSLFRNLNFLAANISQVLAGAVELGLGFLLPYFLLLVVGVDPVLAGIALIPGTIPIIVAGPLAGRLFDRYGGRWPLVGGFVVLAGSGLALAFAASAASAWALMPGLVLQGVGLGIVLTVNDPVGMGAVDADDQGQAAGVINTTEQLGGAIGIAALTAVELGVYYPVLFGRIAEKGIVPKPEQSAEVHEFIAQAEDVGLNNATRSPVVQSVYEDLIASHIIAFQMTFIVSAVIAILGALACFVLVRATSRVVVGPVFVRRSRWISASPPRR
jgi:EmrB/QacA subfamily drug resistance transporter